MRRMSLLLAIAAVTHRPTAALLLGARSPTRLTAPAYMTASRQDKALASVDRVAPPQNEEQMLTQAAEAVERARADGINRAMLRMLLTRGGALVPPDESWEGGIMQLYAVCSPLAQKLLRRLSSSIAGVPPAMREQRLDASGVDGESVWMAQSSRPADDGVAFVQPSTEVLPSVQEVCSTAGSRPVLLVNPQWREGDDPLDALSRQDGVIGAIGSFLGGKAATERTLADLGFATVYTLAQFSCRGSPVTLVRSYPGDWGVYADQPDSVQPEFVFSSPERPTYQTVEEQLIAKGVPFRFAGELFTPAGILPDPD